MMQFGVGNHYRNNIIYTQKKGVAFFFTAGFLRVSPITSNKRVPNQITIFPSTGRTSSRSPRNASAYEKTEDFRIARVIKLAAYSAMKLVYSTNTHETLPASFWTVVGRWLDEHLVSHLRFSVFGLIAILTAIAGAFHSTESGAAGVRVVQPMSRSSFVDQTPEDWELQGDWMFSTHGAMGKRSAQAICKRPLPESCIVEMIVDVPNYDEDAKTRPAAVLAVGQLPAKERSEENLELRFSWSEEGYDATLAVGDKKTKPVFQTWLETASASENGTTTTVSLAVSLGDGRYRALVNGSQEALILSDDLAERHLTITAVDGVVLRSVRVWEGLPGRYVPLSGASLGFNNSAVSREPADLQRGSPSALLRMDCDGIPMIAQLDNADVLALDVSKEDFQPTSKYRRGKPLGTGLLTGTVPARPYSHAYLLFHVADATPDQVPAMGFGPRTVNLADVRNIYLSGRAPTNDEGVTVTAVPALGENWHLARVDLNPAVMHWMTHRPQDGKPRPPETGARLPFHLGRPLQNWYLLRHAVSPPQHEGKSSSLRVAAITFVESPFVLTVSGNGLGNVYDQPEEPALAAIVRNLTNQPLNVTLATELTPYGREPLWKRDSLALAAGGVVEIPALATPITERGHYKIRVCADAGALGQSQWRTNVALLAPDTRKQENSRFGCWPLLSGDQAASEQRSYLFEKAGIGFELGKHTYTHRLFGIRNSQQITSKAAAEEVVKGIGPDIRILMFGWERAWSSEHTHKLPVVVTEGKPEVLSPEISTKADNIAQELKLLSAALRRLRPDVKISLGNTAINWVVPLLERGIRYGEHFDYFGTEEGLYTQCPERPCNFYGNINWWARAICEHFGFHNVPLFHSESIYFSTGPGFSRISEREQAAWYVRTYLIGMAYDSIYGLSGAMVDSSAAYMYTVWGMPGYCNQAPECSPKLSYVAYATMTQLLDGASYEGKLDTDTPSVYALSFKQPDGQSLYALWNLRGERKARLTLAPGGKPMVVDALNRPLQVSTNSNEVSLTLSDLPLYVRGTQIEAIELGVNVPQQRSGRWKQLASLPDPSAWNMTGKADTDEFVISSAPELMAPKASAADALSIRLRQRGRGQHGILHRRLSLAIDPAETIEIPAGTTRLGLWVYGNCTWAEIRFRVRDSSGEEYVPLEDNVGSIMTDNFDGWRFLSTPYLHKFGTDIADGGHRVAGLQIAMPEQQVYVDELMTTRSPWLAVSGIYVSNQKDLPINYLPW
jgi:hypothetical protein